MSITVEVAGMRFSTFIDYRISRSVEDLSGSFDLSFPIGDERGTPFENGSAIRILINNTPVLTGYVEKLKVDYSDNNHIVRISGRDKVCDFIDSTVGSNLELKAPITLNQIIQKVMTQINMTGVKIINQAGADTEVFKAGDLVSGQIDETIFNFLEKYTRKRQLLMTTDGLGNVLLARCGSKRSPVPIIHRMKEDQNQRNNVLNATVSYDESDRFHLYRVHSQGNPTSTTTLGKTDNKELTNRLATAIDPEIRPSRILDITAESSTDTATLDDRAEWEANIRAARGIIYTVDVQGHTMGKNGAPWEPNVKAQVDDEKALIDGTMLIKSVEYTLTVGEGSITTLEFCLEDSFLPEPSISKKKAKSNKTGKKKGKGKGLLGKYNKFRSDVFGET